jgi:pantoate--beta-alanine ligase
MRVIADPTELRPALADLRLRRKTIGFVPTMGALHDGHLSLVRVSREQTSAVVVSIFVNPTQFGPNEDFRIYPRTPEADLEFLEREGVDIVFMPPTELMYPRGSKITVYAGPVGETFEGAIRPGHFDGVLTIVIKLFNLVQPDVAVFGQKDAQQLFLIRRMVTDLNVPVRVMEGDTIRESDGLAKSSRNVYLKVQEREKASVLHRALATGQRLFDAGNRSLADFQRAMHAELAFVPEFTPDYATAVSEASFMENDPVADSVRLIVAGRLGPVRLIDNFRLSASR